MNRNAPTSCSDCKQGGGSWARGQSRRSRRGTRPLKYSSHARVPASLCFPCGQARPAAAISVGSRQQPEGGVLLLVYEMRLAHRRTLYFVLRGDIFCCVLNLYNRTHAVALQVREPDQKSRGEGGNPKVQRTKYIQCLCILISPLSSRVLPSERSVPSP